MSANSGPDLTGLQKTYDVIARDYAAASRQRGFLEATLHQLARRLPAQACVLDLGCGPGFDCARLQAAGWRVVGLDLSWGMLQIARRECGADLVQADVRQLPFAAGFDAALAVASLVHLPRSAWPGVLTQVARLLKPGGWFYLSVKSGQGEAWVDRSYGQPAPRYFVYWQLAAVDRLLAEAGFTLSDHDATSVQPGGWISRLVCKRSAEAQFL